MDQPTAAQALRSLEPLVGEWTMVAGPPGGEPWAGAATTIFTWHPCGAHLLQHSTIEHPAAPNGFCVIGCDAANGTYFQLYSDDRGVSRVYQMSIGDGVWKLWRDNASFAQRFTGVFSEDGNTITGRWELAEDGSNYATDFDITYSRVSPH